MGGRGRGRRLAPAVEAALHLLRQEKQETALVRAQRRRRQQAGRLRLRARRARLRPRPVRSRVRHIFSRAREPRARRWPDAVAEAYAREAAPDVTFAFGARTRDGGHIECREVPGRLRGAVAAADGRAARCPEADVAYVNASGRVDRERTSAHRRRVTAEVRLLRDYERAAAPPGSSAPSRYDVRRLGDAAWRSFDSPEDAIRGFPCAHRPPVWDFFETCARARSRRRRFGRCSDESSSLGARFAERAGAHASSARPSTSGGRFECGAGGFPGLTREACADLVDACVEIKQ